MRLAILLSFLCFSWIRGIFAQEPVNPLVEGNNQFAFDFFKQVRNQKGNLFISPYSISTAFAMPAAGAKNDTANEMMRVLHFSPEVFPEIGQLNQRLSSIEKRKGNSPILKLANAAWVQNGVTLLESYQKVLQKDFGSHLANVDFADNPVKAIAVINDWVSDNTNGKIKDLLTSGDIASDTKLVLTTAVYMKGQWVHAFKKEATRDSAFYIDPQHIVDTPMMNLREEFLLFVDGDAAVVSLPYMHEASGPKLQMIVVLPSSLDGLSKLESNLTHGKWKSWLENMKLRTVNLTFPKFKIENKISLNDPMKALGMKKAFTKSADFSGITGRPDLFISQAIHQTYVDVDEEGTEAAAATGLVMRTTSVHIPEPPYTFVADHPFLFFIMDQESQAILFMGHFVQPRS